MAAVLASALDASALDASALDASALAAPTGAATLVRAWAASIGPAGAYGTAAISARLDGTGSLTVRLAKLRPATVVPIAVTAGTCASPGAAVVSVRPLRASRTGKASASIPLTSAQVSAIVSAASDAPGVSIRVGGPRSGGLRCARFAARTIPAYVAATIEVGDEPSGVAISSTGVWVTNWADGTLSRIDPASNTVLQTFPVDVDATSGPEAVTEAEGALWVTVTAWDASGNALSGSVRRIDPLTGRQTASIATGRGPFLIAAGAGSLWVILGDDDAVARIDAATNTVAATIPVPDEPRGVAVGTDAVWVSLRDGRVLRMDPVSGSIVATIQTQARGGSVALAPDAVWVANPGTRSDESDGMLTRIDPASGRVVSTVRVGISGWEITVAGGSVWTGTWRVGRSTWEVVRVDAASGAVLDRIPVADAVYALAAGPHDVWVVHYTASEDDRATVHGTVTRIGY